MLSLFNLLIASHAVKAQGILESASQAQFDPQLGYAVQPQIPYQRVSEFFSVPSSGINQEDAYDAAYIASLNGRMPEWKPSFPVVGNSYLVPVYVDEGEEAQLHPAYQWVDPSDPNIWNFLHTPYTPQANGGSEANGVNPQNIDGAGAVHATPSDSGLSQESN